LLIQQIVPQARPLKDLADPIGFIALLTVTVIVTQVAGKAMWWIVIAGWSLIALRLGLFFAGYDGS
jgi:hypothetical protein